MLSIFKVRFRIVLLKGNKGVDLAFVVIGREVLISIYFEYL